MPASFLRIHPADSVVIALRDLVAGETIENGIIIQESIPRGHKVATTMLRKADPVLKFSLQIGVAGQDIVPGSHVHAHNLVYQPSGAAYEIGVDAHPTNYIPKDQQAHFQGIVRADGQIATRNYIGVLTTVNCSATVARLVSEHFRGPIMEQWPNVDGIVALTHRTGCGLDADGETNELLYRTLAGYARHPNFAGVVVVGLGCEGTQMDKLFAKQGLTRSNILQDLIIQETGGTTATVKAAIAKIETMLEAANTVQRQSVSAEYLTLGLQCGGSDGFSGLSANPALGAAVDLLVRHGGTAVLSETPEIYGAESMLLRRAASREVGEKLLDRLKWWEEYTARNAQSMDNNPSPGNKKGGLTTILEKSLGATAKGGTTTLQQVYGYAEPITSKGFVFMDTPGYDPVSATGQVAGGCNAIIFTTGRGSCFGCKPVPSMKLATNTPLYQRMSEDMDINCGEIIDGTASVNEMGERIFEQLLKVASGEKTASERLGYGEDEFAPWILGATM